MQPAEVINEFAMFLHSSHSSLNPAFARNAIIIQCSLPSRAASGAAPLSSWQLHPPQFPAPESIGSVFSLMHIDYQQPGSLMNMSSHRGFAMQSTELCQAQITTNDCMYTRGVEHTNWGAPEIRLPLLTGQHLLCAMCHPPAAQIA